MKSRTSKILFITIIAQQLNIFSVFFSGFCGRFLFFFYYFLEPLRETFLFLTCARPWLFFPACRLSLIGDTLKPRHITV
jgi:hypothetical protein